MEFSSYNPTTGKRLQTYSLESDAAIFKKLESAKNQFNQWKRSDFSQRAKIISNISKLLIERKLDLAKIISLEMGKIKKEAIAEIEKCAWLCDYYVSTSKEALKDEKIVADGVEHFVSYEPLGVVLSIMPWNFPFWQALRFAVPTLMAGNTTLIKHSNTVPECAFAIEKLFIDAGAPKGLLQILNVSHSQIESLMKRSEIRGVSLTGSTEAGKKIGLQAGGTLKKMVLELGGSDPFIILNDADLGRAVNAAMVGRFLNCGQSCIAAKRFIVHKSVSLEFLSMMKNRISQLVVGEPWDDNTNLGPLINATAVSSLQEQLNKSLQLGATIVCGGQIMQKPGYFFEPTLVSGVTEDMPLFKEEVFGPIAPVMTFESDEQAVQIANNTIFGLGASVWSTDLERAKKIVSQIECGTVFINSFVKSDPRMPFGGSKESGLGRELSTFGLKEFTNVKSFSVYK